MRKTLSLMLLLLTLSVQTIMAQEAKKLQVYKNGEVTHEVVLAEVDSLIFKVIEDAAVKTHVLTLEKTVGGTITASWSATGNQPAGSKTSSDTTAVTADVPHGAKVTIANTPAEGYTFTSVSANDFTMTGDTTITATFTKQVVTKKIYIGNETQAQFDNMSANSIEEQIITESLEALQSRAEEVVSFEDTVTTKEIEYTRPSDKCAVYVLVPDGYKLTTWATNQFGVYIADDFTAASIKSHDYAGYTMYFRETYAGGVPSFSPGSTQFKFTITKE